MHCVAGSRRPTDRPRRNAVLATVAVVALAGLVSVAFGSVPRTATIALTFDDLPVHGPVPPGKTRCDIARSILAALAAHHAPATYGFVNAKGLEGVPTNAEFLKL